MKERAKSKQGHFIADAPRSLVVVSHPPTPNGRWRCQRLARGLGEHALAWDGLNNSRFRSHPLLCANFVDGLLRHFGDGREHLCWLEVDGRAQAMCILVRKSWWRWSSFLPSQAQISPSLISEPAHVDGLIRCLPGHVLSLELLSIDPQVCKVPVSAPGVTRWHQALTMNVETACGFDDYWQSLSSNLRKNIRKYEARGVADFGSVKHVQFTAAADMPAAVARYGEMEAAGWKGKQGTAISPDNAQGQFYSELLQRMATAGKAQVHELWFAERLAASRLIVSGDDQRVILKTTYDEDLARYAPGRVLLKVLLADGLADSRNRRFEFYTNATRDQLSWATSSRSIRNIGISRNMFAGFALSSARALRHATQSPPMAADLTVKCYDSPGALPANAKALLQSTAGTRSIELSADWFSLLAQHVVIPPAQAKLFVLTRDDDTLAVLPMMLANPGDAEMASLASFYTSLCGPIVQPGLRVDDLVALVQGVRVACPEILRFTFGPMDPEGPEFSLWHDALERSGLVTFPYFRFGHWTLCSQDLNYKQFLASRSGAVRNTVARMSKRFLAEGGRLELVQSEEHLDTALQAYEQVYAGSWKRAEPYPAFVRELFRLCAQRGWLRLGIAWVGPTPVAAQCWIVAHGRGMIFKLAYAEAFKQLSAGTLLTAMLMEHVIDTDQVREVDYLIGDDAYKSEWMDNRDERWGVIAFDPKRLRGLAGIATQLAGNLARRWRSNRTTSQSP